MFYSNSPYFKIITVDRNVHINYFKNILNVPVLLECTLLYFNTDKCTIIGRPVGDNWTLSVALFCITMGSIDT